jgi:hypothetical protein
MTPTILLAPLVAGWPSQANFTNYVFPGSRINVGGTGLTCGGARFTEAIAQNIRGENPSVPVSPIARYPLLAQPIRFLSYFHTYSAMVVLAIVYFQLLLPKATQPASRSRHIIVGRFLVYGVLTHYFPIAYVLNYFAIGIELEEWKLAPPASEWRMQVSYIIPFAVTTTVASFIGFWIHRDPWPFGRFTAKVLLGFSYLSIAFWLTVGLYQTGSQGLKMGMGSFGQNVVSSTNNPEQTAAIQNFWSLLNLVLVFVGSAQAGLDYLNARVLRVLIDSGNEAISWKDQHKWGVFVFSYQAILIWAIFLAYFPWCVFGLPEWTCISSPLFAMVPILVMITATALTAIRMCGTVRRCKRDATVSSAPFGSFVSELFSRWPRKELR